MAREDTQNTFSAEVMGAILEVEIALKKGLNELWLDLTLC
jgi:hypothetical protein